MKTSQEILNGITAPWIREAIFPLIQAIQQDALADSENQHEAQIKIFKEALRLWMKTGVAKEHIIWADMPANNACAICEAIRATQALEQNPPVNTIHCPYCDSVDVTTDGIDCQCNNCGTTWNKL